jgi:predicted nucleic acid-binding protein
MKVLLDTNVAIDVLSGRDGYEASLEVLRLCEAGIISCFITTSIITDIVYIMRKYLNSSEVKSKTRTLLCIVDLIEVSSSDIMNGFDSSIADYEDAVIAICAKRNNMDYIITSDKNHFRQSEVKSISPTEFLKLKML